ncbi:MAG: hypothetical protein GY810_27585 [Aureispira sp.]|nr:hypothetical protein [Aureispira sp.]
MCDLTKGFKLCSCDEEQLKREDIGWRLQRVDPNREMVYRKGRASIHTFNLEQETLRNKIVQDLNYQNCFDFDFEPQQDDRLQIKFAEHQWFAYRYQNGQWQKDDSTSLDGWRSLLDNHKNGKIE